MTTDPKFYQVVDVTWPAARTVVCGPFTLREGQGGGSRVSSATLEADAASEAQITAAEAGMLDLGQRPKFMIRDGQTKFDSQLADRGYQILDPVNIWACPVERLTDTVIPRVTTFAVWEPLAICREIWESGGIGAARQAIMARAECPKIALLGRHKDKPAGAGFCGIHDGIAMVHALEILPHQRRQGMGAWMMRQAAFWAAENGADTLSVICTKGNDGANGLYASLGMTCVGEYHYRHLPQGD
ncbi:MAG: GNAT family N-acetyltransferase [Rhodobacteraceae bacterium]|nr:GNAT family N-acetyltransferase [Paracoccaceae bacterium]